MIVDILFRFCDFHASKYFKISNLLPLSVHDEGYSRSVQDEGYSRSVHDEGYSRNASWALSLLYQFLFFSLIGDLVVALSILDEVYPMLTKCDIYVLHSFVIVVCLLQLMVYHGITIATLFKEITKEKAFSKLYRHIWQVWEIIGLRNANWFNAIFYHYAAIIHGTFVDVFLRNIYLSSIVHYSPLQYIYMCVCVLLMPDIL